MSFKPGDVVQCIDKRFEQHPKQYRIYQGEPLTVRAAQSNYLCFTECMNSGTLYHESLFHPYDAQEEFLFQTRTADGTV